MWGAVLRMTHLAIVLAATILTGSTSTAKSARPITYVYVLLGGFVGLDGFLDSDGMLLLAQRITVVPDRARVGARFMPDDGHARCSVAQTNGRSGSVSVARSKLYMSLPSTVPYSRRPAA